MKLFNLLNLNSSDEDLWQVLLKLEKKIKGRIFSANATVLCGTSLFYLYGMFLIYSIFSPLLISMFLKPEDGVTLFHTLSIQNIFSLLPLPWYVTLILIPLGLFAVPWLVSALMAGITFLFGKILFPLRKTPLPEDFRERKEMMARKAKELYHKQYKSTGLDLGTKPNYVFSTLFAILPVVFLFLCAPIREDIIGLVAHFASHIPEILSWLLIFLIFAIIFGIPALIFSYLMLIFELWFDTISRPLYWGRHWHPRCKALKTVEEALYRRWIAVDPEEKKKDNDRKKREQEEWEKKQKFKEEFRRTMAGVYLKEQKEHEAYLKRLHEWAKDDDGIDWRGKGDGI